jgi:hypothetical protein
MRMEEEREIKRTHTTPMHSYTCRGKPRTFDTTPDATAGCRSGGNGDEAPAGARSRSSRERKHIYGANPCMCDHIVVM